MAGLALVASITSCAAATGTVTGSVRLSRTPMVSCPYVHCAPAGSRTAAGAEVLAQAPDGAVIAHTTVATTGDFRLQLPPGRYAVRLQGIDYPATDKIVTVTSGTTVTVTLQLPIAAS